MVINPKQPWKQSRRPSRMAQKPPELPLVTPGAMQSTIGLAVPLGLAFLVLLFHGCVRPAQAQESNIIVIERIDYERFAEAIYQAEGAERAAVPYGILSVPCSSKKECRDICTRTIRHYWQDFKQAKQTGIENFIEYASHRYVGSGRQDQQYWKENVEFFYLKRGKLGD